MPQTFGLKMRKLPPILVISAVLISQAFSEDFPSISGFFEINLEMTVGEPANQEFLSWLDEKGLDAEFFFDGAIHRWDDSILWTWVDAEPDIICKTEPKFRRVSDQHWIIPAVKTETFSSTAQHFRFISTEKYYIERSTTIKRDGEYLVVREFFTRIDDPGIEWRETD